MNKVGKKIIVCLNLLIIMLFTVFGAIPAFAAEEEKESALVYVIGYEVPGGAIVPGSDFTLILTVKNVSSRAMADDVVLSVTNPAGVAPEYGTVSTAYVGILFAGDTARVPLKYTANANMSVEELKFSVNVICDGGTTINEVRVPVVLKEKAQVFVAGYEASTQEVALGSDFTLTVKLKNQSKDTAAKDVLVTLNNLEGVVPQYGTLCTARVDSIRANGSAEVKFKLSCDKNFSASNLKLVVEVAGEGGASSNLISIPVEEMPEIPEEPEVPEVGIIGYEATKKSIAPGDKFSVSLNVKNFSKETNAENITVMLTSPAGVILEYGTLNAVRIEQIAANAIEKVKFTFTATSALSANELYFTASVSGGKSPSEMQFCIPVGKAPQLSVVGYEVSNGLIIPGNDFALKVKIKNQSTEVTAENIEVMIADPNGVIPEYGKVGSTFIESIAPGAIEEICFRYSSDTTIKTSNVSFNVGVLYNELSTSAQIRVPTGRMTDVSVDRVSMPDQLLIGKTGYASAMIENLEETEVSNVIMVARCNGKDIASAKIGTMSAKTYKTQAVSLMFEEEGQYAVDLLLTYTNGEGENKEYVISSGFIQVVDEEKVKDNNNDSSFLPVDVPSAEQSNGVSRVLLLSISGVLLIILCCVVLILLYRRKK